MKKLLIAFLFLLFALPTFGADVTLTWDSPGDSRVVGYVAYYWEYGSDRAYGSVIDTTETSVPILGLTEGKTYQFAARSVADNEMMSDWSETLDYAVPVYIPICPQNMRVVVTVEPIP